MTDVEWSTLLVIGFVWLSLALRLHRLGNQLGAVSHAVRREMAKLLGNEKRATELSEEWDQERKMLNWQVWDIWITWIGGAAMLAWWWFTRVMH